MRALTTRWRTCAVASGALVLCFILTAAGPTYGGGEARYFRAHSQADFLAGTLTGMAVDPTGNLSLADRVRRVDDLGEPFLFSIAEHPSGWVVGTGNAGKVLLVRREGGVDTLFSAPEPEIFAVWADSDGTVFAGSSPDGKVYRFRGGASEVFFEPEETYIWSLARDAAGRLLVATGTEGRLYRVDDNGRGEVFFDSDDTHIRALLAADDGVLLGTAGEGLVLRLSNDGSARTLYDATEPEVVALAHGPGGALHAALLASEASLVDLASRKEKADADKEDSAKEEGAETVVTVSADAAPAFSGSRPAGFKGARSLVVRIGASGLVEPLWRFKEETVYSMRWHRERLWVGTGLDGKLYSLQNGKMVLEKDVDERQIVALAGGDPGPAFATTNAAAVFEVSTESEPAGTYTSAALDAEQIARFGTLRWQGTLLDGGDVRFAARSGMSSEPDRTWSSWSEPQRGREVDLSRVPAGRFLQWRAAIEGGKASEPSISEVTISYVQENLAPRIERFSALGPGEVFVPTNFNPGNQVFEPMSPARGGIFTTIQAASDQGESRKKKLWKKGFQTLVWEVEDPNDDELVFSLLFGREGAANGWLPMVEDLEDDYYSFDSAALPDGRYRFLLRAADRKAGSAAEKLVSEETSEPVIVDNSVPVLGDVKRTKTEIEIEVRDALSPLRMARLSRDAEEWTEVVSSDGLLDGQREVLRVPTGEPARLLLLQVMDAAFNVVTFDLSGEK